MLKQQLASILKHGGIYGLGRILSRAVGFLMIPVYTRYLTPDDYGILELIDLALGVIGLIIANGINSSIFRFYHKYEDAKDKNAVVSTAILCVMATTGFCSLFVFAFRGPISNLLFSSHGYTSYLALASLTFFFNLAGDIPLGYLRVKQMSIRYTAISLSRLILEISLNIFFVVHLQKGVLGVLMTQFASACIFSGYLLFVAFRETGIHFSWIKAQPMLRFGIPLIPSSLGMFIINYGDRFFLKHYTDLKQVGIYSLGYKFGYMISYLALQPFMLIWDSKMYEIAKHDGAPRLYGRIFTYLVLTLVFAGLGLSLFIREMVQLMTDRAFWSASAIVPLIILAYILQGFYYFFQIGLYLKDKTSQVGGVIFSASLLTLAMYYYLIRAYSSMGAALSTVLAFALISGMMWTLSQRAYRVEYEYRRILVLVASAGALYAAKLLASPEAVWPAMALNVALLAAFPALLFLFRFFSEEEKAAMAGFLGRLGIGKAAA